MKTLFSLFAIMLALFAFEADAALSGVQQVDANYVVVQGATGNSFRSAANANKTITNLALTSNVVTITATHDYVVGQIVTINLTSGPTLFADCNGTFAITGVTSTTAFTYAFTHANISTGAATGTAAAWFESPIATATTQVALVWPTNATRLFLTTSGICNISSTATTVAAGTGGSYNTVAATIYELYGKPGDITYINRTNTSIVNFRFSTLN